MNNSSIQTCDEAIKVFGLARSKGIEFWSEQGRLHFRAPRGSLSRHEIDRLRHCKEDILALLGRRQVPLSFSQRAHWNLYNLSARPAIRQLASATRLRGPLDVALLERSLNDVVLRHDALRTRIAALNGILVQEISPEAISQISIQDLSKVTDESQDRAINRSIESQIMRPIDPERGPLWEVSLLRLAPDDHVLVLTMEHMISDAASVGIFLSDLLTAYAQGRQERQVTLPPVALQFADYAEVQHKSLASWHEKHDPYWAERFAEHLRLRFPSDVGSSPGVKGWGTIPLHIDRHLKAGLQDWSRSRKSTLVLAVFTALAGLTLRWCNEPAGIFQFQTDGRLDHRIENSIGYFASVLYMRLTLHPNDTFTTLLSQVTREYCSAYEHADQSYMEAQEPRPEFAKNCCFNWVPQPLGSLSDRSLDESTGLTSSPLSFEHPMLRTLERDNEPVVLLFEDEHEVMGGLHFALAQMRKEPMERFAAGFLLFLRSMLEEPERPVSQIQL